MSALHEMRSVLVTFLAQWAQSAIWIGVSSVEVSIGRQKPVARFDGMGFPLGLLAQARPVRFPVDLMHNCISPFVLCL